MILFIRRVIYRCDAVIAISIFVGALINFIGINPIAALFWTAVINGVLAPPLLVIIMIVSNNKKIMGKRVNGRFTNLLVGRGNHHVCSHNRYVRHLAVNIGRHSFGFFEAFR